MNVIASNTNMRNSKELIESLKEYRKVIEKAKSQQSLKNYHKKFRENLQFKLDKSHEKQCERISNCITPSLYSLHSFDIWPILYSYRNKNLEILVPTTLYRDSNLEFLVKSERALEFFNGPDIFESFLKDVPKYSNIPVCLYKPARGKMKLFSSEFNVRQFLASQKNFQGYFQYFIPPSGLNPSLVLVNYHKGSQAKSYILKNSNEIPVNDKNIEKTENHMDSVTTDKFLHTMLTEFSNKNVQRPLKRKVTFDFSSSLNNSAVLPEQSSMIESSKPKNFTNLIQRIKSIEGLDDSSNPESSQLFLDNNTSKFLVDLSNTRVLTPYNLIVKVKPLEHMTKTLFNSIEIYMKKKFAKDVQELNLSFIKDINGDFIFLKVNALKYAQPYKFEGFCDLGESLEENSFHMSFMENSRILNTTFIPIVQNAQRKMSELKTVIKIKNVQDLKAKHLKVVKKRNSLNLNVDVKRCIDDAVNSLDLMKRNIRMRKKSYQDLSVKYSASSFWKAFTVQVYRFCIKSSLGRVFKRMSNEKFYGMSKGLFRVFCSDIGPNFVRDLVRIHKNLNITSEEYSEFKSIIMNNLKYYVTAKDDLELVEVNLESLRSSIANVNT